MFVMVRVRAHEHMELLVGFEVDCLPWGNLHSPWHVSSVLVWGLAIAYLAWYVGVRTLM